MARTFSDSEIDLMFDDAMRFVGYSRQTALSFAPEDRHSLQLAALKRRFTQLRGRIPMMDKLADLQGIHAIHEIDDVLPLLYDATTYKSFPQSLIDNHRFQDLTRWLAKLTTEDLSQVDATGCRSIDEWLGLLKRETPLGVIHTSGTSGSMSFIPATKQEWSKHVKMWALMFCDDFGPDFRFPANIDVVYPGFRTGYLSHALMNDYWLEAMAGSEERLHVAYPGQSLSADMMLLAARQRAAKAKGLTGELKVDPALKARAVEFEAQQRGMEAHMAAFYETIRTGLAGKRIWAMAVPSLLIPMAEKGLAEGMRHVFAPNSVINTGGGGKGIVLADDWQEPVKEFFGVRKINSVYGMSELSSPMFGCEHDNYHIPPWMILFMLDEENSPLPREGRVTGRPAFYDLLISSRWGGFVSGDEITVEWDEPCPCGESNPYILKNSIHRWSDRHKSSGEERISCAAAPDIYAEALDFLTAANG